MSAMASETALQHTPKASAAAPFPSAVAADAAAPEPMPMSSYVQSCIDANAQLHRELMEMTAKPWFWYSGTLVLDLVEYTESTWTDAEMLGLGLGPLIFTSLRAFIYRNRCFEAARGFYHPGDIHANGCRIWKNYDNAKNAFIWYSKRYSTFYCSDRVVLDTVPPQWWENVEVFCSFGVAEFIGQMAPEMSGTVHCPPDDEQPSVNLKLRTGDQWYSWMGDLKKRKLEDEIVTPSASTAGTPAQSASPAGVPAEAAPRASTDGPPAADPGAPTAADPSAPTDGPAAADPDASIPAAPGSSTDGPEKDKDNSWEGYDDRSWDNYVWDYKTNSWKWQPTAVPEKGSGSQNQERTGRLDNTFLCLG
ncbi:unnamed protein product [Symbiodinium sp. CCMP2592]|nr:unnamed protein product [Symbiodinium sp. CCMP2592]